MTEPIFLGIDKPTWDLVNGFANWFAAAGSFAAAAVALYIANRSARPSAELSVGHRIIGADSVAPYPEYVVFRVVNTGDRPIRIVQIGWSIRWPKRRSAVQMFERSLSSQLPVDLSHGQEASWYVPLNAREEHWMDYFAKDMLTPSYRLSLWSLRAQLSLWSLRAQAFSSVGFVFTAKPEQGLLRRLREACERVSKNAS
jgi:hypothetical protein